MGWTTKRITPLSADIIKRNALWNSALTAIVPLLSIVAGTLILSAESEFSFWGDLLMATIFLGAPVCLSFVFFLVMKTRSSHPVSFFISGLCLSVVSVLLWLFLMVLLVGMIFHFP